MDVENVDIEEISSLSRHQSANKCVTADIIPIEPISTFYSKRLSDIKHPMRVALHGKLSVKKRCAKRYEISKQAIRRLAGTVGVNRLHSGVYDLSLRVLETFLEDVLADAITYSSGAERKTVRVEDIQHALLRRGIRIYGFD
ncbi:core histone H2A/H2B/H3/H4 [Dictyocaulus viviparus]|uniref:Histone H4 n=1 Tax=Dictyocaulus viviparus TaxID=29172 RepID=A0A0D8XZA5_DICVI|nr:core histone H2A/H2B/H3/H4 [Dictyocaulus viviparus]